MPSVAGHEENQAGNRSLNKTEVVPIVVHLSPAGLLLHNRGNGNGNFVVALVVVVVAANMLSTALEDVDLTTMIRDATAVTGIDLYRHHSQSYTPTLALTI